MEENFTFSITLPSNASMDLYPDNTVSNYTTKLANPIILKDNWQCALAEFTYRQSISYNIGFAHYTNPYNEKTSIEIIVHEGESWFNLFDNMSYRSVYIVQDDAIPNIPMLKFHQYSLNRNTFEVTKDCKVRFSGLFAKLLDFPTNQVYSEGIYSIHKDFMHAKTFQKNEAFFIYVDIIKDQFVGDSKSKLISTLSLKGNVGEAITISNSILNFVDVSKNYIDKITINIKDSQGKDIHFENLTKSILRLVFRKKPQY